MSSTPPLALCEIRGDLSPVLVSSLSDQAQLAQDVCASCLPPLDENSGMGMKFGSLCRQIAVGDEPAKSEYVRRLIALRDSNKMTELTAAILMARAKLLDRGAC